MSTEPEYYDWQADQFVYPDGRRVNAEHDRHDPNDYQPELDPHQEALLIHLHDQIGAMTADLLNLPHRNADPRDDPL